MRGRGEVVFRDVAGHFKTSQPGSNQNRPIRGALFISGFLTQIMGFSISSYLLLLALVLRAVL